MKSSQYEETYTSTIGVDFEIKHIVLDGKKVNLQIWDTAGQERFRTITTSYYRVSDVVILVFDVTEPQSFANVVNWLEDVRSYASDAVDIILVGNKTDLESSRKISFDKAKHYASEHNLIYMESSAKSGYNVEEVFSTIAKSALQRKVLLKRQKVQSSPGIQIGLGGASDDPCGC